MPRPPHPARTASENLLSLSESSPLSPPTLRRNHSDTLQVFSTNPQVTTRRRSSDGGRPRSPVTIHNASTEPARSSQGTAGRITNVHTTLKVRPAIAREFSGPSSSRPEQAFTGDDNDLFGPIEPESAPTVEIKGGEGQLRGTNHLSATVQELRTARFAEPKLTDKVSRRIKKLYSRMAPATEGQLSGQSEEVSLQSLFEDMKIMTTLSE